MTEDTIVGMLKAVPGAFEAYLRTDYEVYRNKKDGGTQKVNIAVYDSGPSMRSSRYHVVATSDDGRTATGNPAESLEITMAIVHWGALDR